MYAAVIVRQLSNRGPAPWQAFGIGALATVAVGLLDVGGTVVALRSAIPVVAFLFALFVFAIALERAGVLDHLARWLIGHARSPRDLPLILFLGFGAISAFLVNDALVLLGVPLLFSVARRQSLPVRPLLLTLAFSVTVGSVLTPLGNPQNLLVSLSSGLSAPVATFLRFLLLPTALNLVLGGLYLRWVFGPDLSSTPPVAGPPPRLFPPGNWVDRVRRFPVLVLFPATLVVIVGSDLVSAATGVTGWPIDEVALVGAAGLLLVTPGRLPVLRTVDWSILVLFLALFVVVAGAVQGGVLEAAESLLPIPPPSAGAGALLPIAASSLAGPQLVSNVPWVALQIPVLEHLGYSASTPLAWVALAAASTLAGNVTLLGAASNLILVDESERRGVRIGLREFVRHGLPLTGLTMAVLLGCLALGL